MFGTIENSREGVENFCKFYCVFGVELRLVFEFLLVGFDLIGFRRERSFT